MVAVITDTETVEVAGRADPAALWLAPGEAEQATGWTLKPEGLCKDDVCVPVPAGRESEFVAGDGVNLAAFWRHMGHPAIADAGGDVWSLGIGADARGTALASLEAPDFTLPDREGRPHSLSDHRGKKILLATWSSW